MIQMSASGAGAGAELITTVDADEASVVQVSLEPNTIESTTSLNVQDVDEPQHTNTTTTTTTTTTVPAADSTSTSSGSPPAKRPVSGGSGMIKDQASLSAAIANFRPTSKEVISGIAPHVFDERRRRRRGSKRLPRRPSRSLERTFERERPSYRRTATATATPASPLRFSAVITVEEIDRFLGPVDREGKGGGEEIKLEVDVEQPVVSKLESVRTGKRMKIDIFRWRVFRIDAQVLKSIAMKLKTKS